MEKHHVYILFGLLLTIFGSGLAYFFPHLAGIHNAGMMLAVQGSFDWYYSTNEGKKQL